jgi:hypothetical protein
MKEDVPTQGCPSRATGVGAVRLRALERFSSTHLVH